MVAIANDSELVAECEDVGVGEGACVGVGVGDDVGVGV